MIKECVGVIRFVVFYPMIFDSFIFRYLAIVRPFQARPLIGQYDFLYNVHINRLR